VTEKKIEPADPLRDGMKKLREPFPPECYGKLRKGGAELDYVGHAAVTDRLLTVDPLWNWEPLAVGADGLPAIRRDSKVAALWIKLTVLGKTVLGVGTCELGKGEVEKELIGDALRNAAMRFGVALDLWSKAELESALADGVDRKPPPHVNTQTGELRTPQPVPPVHRPPLAQEAVRAFNREPKASNAPPGNYMDTVNTVDVSAPQIPHALENGDVLLWDVPVPNKVYQGWPSWAQYPVTEEGKTPAQRARVAGMRAKEQETGRENPLLHNTWATMTEGQPNGKRETALRWMVAKAREKVQSGGKLYLDDHRACVALAEMCAARPPSEDPNSAPF